MAVRSIRARLLLLLGFIFTVVSLTAAYRVYERRASDTAYMLEGLQAQAAFIAEQQGDAVRRTERFLEFMTSALNVSALATDKECPAKLETYTQNDDYLANVFITNLQGRVICNPRHTNSPSTVDDREYFQRALGAPSLIVGDPVYGRFTQRWVLPFARKYTNEQGKVLGVVVVALDLSWVNRAFKDISVSRGMRLGLVTSRGIVLARQPDPEDWIGKDISGFPAFRQLQQVNGNGTAEALSHDGHPRIYAFTPFAKTSNDAIYLWVTIPKDIATAKADAQLRLALILIGVLIGLTFSLAWFGGNRFLVRPIETIVAAARRLAKGEAEAQTGLPHSSDEIGQLAMAFDEMANQLARFDALTGLLNLRSFEEMLAHTLVDAKNHDHRLAVVRLKIRDFHHVEGNYGLGVSNEVVKFVGQQLQKLVSGSGILARLGTSNFAIAYPDVHSPLQASYVLENLRKDIEGRQVVVDHLHLDVAICFGVSFFPDDGHDAHELLQHAGVALGQVVDETTSYVRFYEGAMNERLLRRASRLAGLRQAIHDESFELHYQPQIELKTGRLVGVEALVRWNHPTEGRIPPVEFISLAEESGLIVPLGEWILRQAAWQLMTWRRQHHAFSNLVMAVNVSAVQLVSADFRAKLEKVLEETGLPPHLLELEITESQLMKFSEKPGDLVRELKALGLQLSIDDFGTGYSSLAYLKHLAVDKLKIDKSFIDNVTASSDDVAIVQATIAMAHKLGLTVIAEGVEIADQVQCLRELACDEIQGYFFSRPLPAAQAQDFILEAARQQSGLSSAVTADQ